MDDILKELLREDDSDTEDDSDSEEYHVRKRISRNERTRKVAIAKQKIKINREHKKQWGNGVSEPLDSTEDDTDTYQNDGILSFKWIVYPVLVGIGVVSLWYLFNRKPSPTMHVNVPTNPYENFENWL